jgi:acyl-CoA thioesterase FadM
MATAKATVVCIALAERKAVRVPDAFRHQIAAMEDPTRT